VYEGYLVQCYCCVPANCTCEDGRLYSTTDYASAETILDPNGVLNWLAIGYA